MSYITYIDNFNTNVLSNIETCRSMNEDSRPAQVLNSCTPIFGALKTRILTTLTDWYDDRDLDNGENVNFIYLNSVADASETYEQYSLDCDQFWERKEFFWTRGEWYAAQGNIIDGKWLEPWWYVPYSIATKAKEIESLYLALEPEYVPYMVYDNPDDPEDGRLVLFPEDFWDNNISEWSSYVSNAMSEFDEMISDFSFISEQIYEYKELFQESVYVFTLTEKFISAIDKKSTENGTELYSSYTHINDGGFPSSSIGKLFGWFLDSVEYAENSEIEIDNSSYALTRRIAIAVALEKIGFFDSAKVIYADFGDLRTKYNF